MSLTIQRAEESTLIQGEEVKIKASLFNNTVRLNIHAETETALSQDEFLKVAKEIQYLKSIKGAY